MIERIIKPRLLALFRQYPFVTVTGPRQSGKTTLCRDAFPELKYVNLEAPDQREFANRIRAASLLKPRAGALSTKSNGCRPCFPICRFWPTSAALTACMC